MDQGDDTAPKKGPQRSAQSFVQRRLLATRAGRAATLAGVAILGSAILVELACQAVSLSVYRGFTEILRQPNHYYQRSDDPILGYELRPDFTMTVEGRTLTINHQGIRDDTSDLAQDRTRIAILGDSVVFGLGEVDLSQDKTIPAVVQRLLDPEGRRIKVLSFSVPGYGLGEFPRYLQKMSDIYRPSRVVYLMNPNDFTLRDSAYEGADNGLYRLYHHPFLKSPWFARKAIYRRHKGGYSPVAPWYQWLFDGTKDKNLPHLEEMSDFTRQRGVSFGAALLPIGSAYTGEGGKKRFLLSGMFGEIQAFCDGHGIRCFDAVAAFAEKTERFDMSDHFDEQGAVAMAEFLVDRFFADLKPKAP
jgi:hypothetical protein